MCVRSIWLLFSSLRRLVICRCSLFRAINHMSAILFWEWRQQVPSWAVYNTFICEELLTKPKLLIFCPGAAAPKMKTAVSCVVLLLVSSLLVQGMIPASIKGRLRKVHKIRLLNVSLINVPELMIRHLFAIFKDSPSHGFFGFEPFPFNSTDTLTFRFPVKFYPGIS